MCVYFLFLLSIIGLSASDMYRSSVLVPAYETVAEWKVSPEVVPFVKGEYDINVFTEKSDISEKKRLTYYSMGLPIAPIPSEKSNSEYPHVTKIFNLVRAGNLGVYPSDYIVNDASAAGLKNPEVSKLISFGQGEDAFRIILLLDHLYKHGLREIDFDGICFGTQRIINMLFILGHPEGYPGAEKFFAAAGIDRIDREKMLTMIQTISLNASLRKPADPMINITRKLTTKAAYSIAAINAFRLFSKGMRGYSSPELLFSFSKVPLALLILRSMPVATVLGECLFDGYASRFLPSYDQNYPSIEKMFASMEHYKKDYPQFACLYMTKKDDPVVGGFNTGMFFKALPVHDSKKYLIPSNDSNHVTIDSLQVSGKNAFFEKHGSSHYTRISMLKVGRRLLDCAQKHQYLDIDEYIAQMENQDNYNHLMSVGELPFNHNVGLKKASL